uniref:Uncharacterized protein n=1 Tax=Arundo donax TaxID=35708 RepID=A0A0A8YAI8_ARUDO
MAKIYMSLNNKSEVTSHETMYE